MIARTVAILLSLIFLPLPLMPAAGQAAERLALATLDWPPYTSPALPDQGMTSKILADIARAAGHDLTISFFPWIQAIRAGQSDPSYIGYFPAYWTAERAASCNFSRPVGIGRLGLVQRRDRPVSWTNMTDLAGGPIGVVAGYSNGAEFDALIQAGILQVQVSSTDLDNLRMVGHGRIPAAVIDQSVLAYFLATDSSLRKMRAELDFNPRPIAAMAVYICFKKTDEGAHWKEIFDRGLERVNLMAEQQHYLQLLDQSP
ncbi:MAG TPA: transporter substrate-binding domain-containing protein [Dongiaceae bacterium]